MCKRFSSDLFMESLFFILIRALHLFILLFFWNNFASLYLVKIFRDLYLFILSIFWFHDFLDLASYIFTLFIIHRVGFSIFLFTRNFNTKLVTHTHAHHLGVTQLVGSSGTKTHKVEVEGRLRLGTHFWYQK